MDKLRLGQSDILAYFETKKYMGLFDFFKKETKQDKPLGEDPQLEKIEVVPGVFLPRVLASHWVEIEKGKRVYNSITAVRSDDLALEQSKFGHYPIMPLDFDYPVDSKGKWMFPLAQLNFSEMPPLEGYPSSGFLQFYISGFDDVYGLDFDDNQSQKNFKVLYFEENQLVNYKADFSFLDEVMQSDMLPLNKPYALSFLQKQEYIGVGDVQYEESKYDIFKITKKYPDLEEHLNEIIYDEFSCNGHKVGGYAYFTQSDPRSAVALTSDYKLLFQLDSDDEIMWGDVGVANFFISPEDLETKNFSRVIYNWDCC